jgi:anhydro-N-acetylmuramic acid kinase
MYSSKGKTDESLLEKLNSLEFYRLPYPKSLGREWVEKHFWPIIEESPLSTEDKLRTVTEHIALIIGKAIGQKPEQRLLITGGGAFNRFLIGRIRGLTAAKAELPSEAVISFKEAIIFGLLGVLRFEKTANCLKSVTGARIDSCGGAVYHP